MTKRQNLERKLGNAVRALKGGLYTAPQARAQERVQRWADRLLRSNRPLPRICVWARRSS